MNHCSLTLGSKEKQTGLIPLPDGTGTSFYSCYLFILSPFICIPLSVSEYPRPSRGETGIRKEGRKEGRGDE